MKRVIFILLGFLLAFQGYAQNGDPQIFDLGEIGALLSDNIVEWMEKLKTSVQKQPEKTQKSELDAVPATKSQGFLTASLNIEYDMINKPFSCKVSRPV